ncbi:hypothetical protein SAMN05660866_01121 [Maribacter arcticus]|uniref:Uncharacterized protein n=1 Tax=Maribacter arcticus TaxID=561365 RepID=A0A1T5ATC8_9FLAO|nr:hypothetical protein SAMN05660866_01121 [Maribacter arcticus]
MSTNAVLVWTLAAIFVPFLPITARVVFVLIFIIQAIGNRYYKKIRDETVLAS